MGTLKDQLRTDLTAAMKARDKARASTLRMVLTALSKAEVAGDTARELSDEEVTQVLTKEAKGRREAALAFEEGGRAESAEKERAEAAVIAEYLPEQLDEAAIAEVVSTTIAELGVAEDGMKAMGRVMGAVQPKVAGRADGAAVAAEVRRQLG
ncbi:GatB/YqeY domain-containing protein [Nocardioides panacisoli]|uniref:GatB/YqeY domain-containing protein n=1 Tax=Nocardioides panacisoli TaxID=627624 RepID=UPI001C6357B2|nr:GatB/YqeY domain-containing protein [Nocardioides panacisoli]QYJ03691.1 GatB/YqeY domain-containing protein [Nocardioides panacisoli]